MAQQIGMRSYITHTVGALRESYGLKDWEVKLLETQFDEELNTTFYFYRVSDPYSRTPVFFNFESCKAACKCDYFRSGYLCPHIAAVILACYIDDGRDYSHSETPMQMYEYQPDPALVVYQPKPISTLGRVIGPLRKVFSSEEATNSSSVLNEVRDVVILQELTEGMKDPAQKADTRNRLAELRRRYQDPKWRENWGKGDFLA